MNRVAFRITGLTCTLVLASCVAAAAPALGAQPKHAPTSALRAWAKAANGVCRLGIEMYPSIQLGSAADPDTMAYAVDRLVQGISAIPNPASTRFAQLERLGSHAAARWYSIATTPIRRVPMVERRAAAKIVSRYVDQLVALGARACAPLRPRA
jgi:hypothetical protein